jgi:hypothetical protein
MNHLNDNQLQDYMEKSLVQTEYAECRAHLQACKECKQRYRNLQKLNTALHHIPLDHVLPEFTSNILRRLNIKESPSLTWKLFQYLSQVFALALVLTIVYLVFYFTGALQGIEANQSISYTQLIYNKIETGTLQGMKSFNMWLGKYFSFAFASNTYTLSIFLAIFFSIIALFDKFVIAPMMRRKTKI